MTNCSKQGTPGQCRRAGAGWNGRFEAVEKEVRDFGLALSLFLAVLAGIALLRARENLVPPLLLSAVLVCGLAVLWPLPLWPVQRLAMLVAGAVGWFNTRLLLGLVFYLVLTPTALILRLFGKDLMDRSWRPELPSYWRDRPEPEYDPAQDEKQF
jgi:hypothetical protein